MEYSDQELIARLEPFTASLKTRLSTRACIVNNAELLLILRGEGYRVDDLIELSGCSYSRQTFSSVLSTTKIKSLSKTGVKKTIIGGKGQVKKDDSAVNVQPAISEKQDLNVDKWIAAFNFSKPVAKKPIEKQIAVLIKAGWDTDNYHILRDKLSITTITKLIECVNNIRSSKFNKNIFKDNKACF